MEDFKIDFSEEESFPVSFNKFMEYTNVIDLVYDQIRKARKNSYEDFINNLNYVKKLSRRFYLHFYMRPKNRKKEPFKDLKLSEDCPKDLKMHLMKIPEQYQSKKSDKVNTPDLVNPEPSTSESCKSKPVDNVDCSNLEELIASSNFPPPSFKVFKKFVNFEEEIKQRNLSCSCKREKFELEFYKEFYAAPTLRHKLNWKLRPCPRRLHEQILTHLPLKNEIILPEGSNITENLTPSNKRSSSPSKTFISPQTKKQKTMETITLPTNIPPASNTNQKPVPNNNTPKNVQAKTASWCSFRIFNDYVAEKIRQGDVNYNSENRIHDSPLKKNKKKKLSFPSEDDSGKKVGKSPSVGNNTNEFETEAQVKKVQIQSPAKSVNPDLYKKVVKKRIESKKKSVSSKDTSTYLASDSDEIDVSSELDMSTYSNFQVCSREKLLPPKSFIANLNPSGGNTTELETEAVVKEVQIQLEDESVLHDLNEKVGTGRVELQPKEKSVSPKDMCANLASVNDFNETDISREVDMSTVRNFSVRSKEKQLPSKSCIANLNPSFDGNTKKLETEELEKEIQIQSQAESVIHNSNEKVVKKRIEMKYKEKSLSPKYTCEYLANIYYSDETDVSSEMSTVRNFPVRSKENQLLPMNCVANLHPSGADCMNDVFFRKVDKSCTLAYAVFRSRGLKRRILLAILKMSLKEFSKYARIHDQPKFHEDAEVLKKMYEFVIKTEQTWPPMLYMTLSETLEYLMSKGIVCKDLNLQHISPKLLHFEELAIITNFDEIVRLDYFKETARKTLDEQQLKERRHSFYNRCWAHDEWIWKVPTVDKNWELITKHKYTDTIDRLITPLGDVSADTENIEMTEALDMETNSTSSSRAADDIKPKNTATEQFIASSWESVLSELDKSAQGLRKTEDDVETVIFPIVYQESTSATQNSYRTNDGSVKDMQDIDEKEITNKLIERSDDDRDLSTSASQAEGVNEESIILNSLDACCSQNVNSIPELTQTPSKSYESNQVQRNIANQLQETTNKTLLPLSPNIFITSSGSTTSQPRSHHDLAEPCIPTYCLSNTSLAISSCTSISSQVNDFFVNMPNTQNQIKALPMDEMLCNDPLYGVSGVSESLERNRDNLLSDSVLNLNENDAESDNQASKQTEDDTLASLELPEEQEQSEEVLPTQVNSTREENTNTVSNRNMPESIPTNNLEHVINARGDSNRELEPSKSDVPDVDKRVLYSPQLNTQATTCTAHLESTDTQLHAVDQSTQSSEPSEERNSVCTENSTTHKQATSFQFVSQPNESFTRISNDELTNVLLSEPYLMDERGRVPLSVKREIVNQNTQLGSKNTVQTENCDLTTIVIDDSDDEAESNVKSAVKVEAKFLNNLQFSFDDTNSSVHVHTLPETPAIIIDDDYDVNKTATILVDQLMNPTEQIQFPSTPLSRISSSLLNDAASTFSEAQRLHSALEESGSVHQTLQSEIDQETPNSNDSLNYSSEDVALLLEINVQKVDNFSDSELEVALNLNDDQRSKEDRVSLNFSSCQTTNLPTEAKTNPTNIAAKKHKPAAATKSNRQTENKNSHLVPQITHAFRSLPVTVVKAKPNENPKTSEINIAPSSSTNILSDTEIINTQTATNNSGANSTKTVNFGSTTSSFSASQALATDCTLFDNSQLLRDLQKVQSNNIETITTEVSAQLTTTSSTCSLVSTTSTTSSSRQEPSTSKQNVGTEK